MRMAGRGSCTFIFIEGRRAKPVLQLAPLLNIFPFILLYVCYKLALASVHLHLVVSADHQ
jgi:hypothetical protein